MSSIMTITEWIKSRIKYDTDHQLTSGRHSPKQINKHNCKHVRKRYITPKRRGHTVCIVNKCPRRLQRPKVISTALPSLSPYTSSNIFCKPHNSAVDSESFTIVIVNHESTKISNRSKYSIGTITLVKGKWSKVLEEWSK